jgi:hypothetical protein
VSLSDPNLCVLKRSNKKPLAGDVFALSPLEGLFIFGRVIRADLEEPAPMPGAYLIYVYRHRSDDMRPSRSELHPGALLLPPLYINRMPWTKGYFQTVDNWPLAGDDLVAQHCFLSVSWGPASPDRYFDEDYNRLPGPIEPCGIWGLQSYRMLDDAVSEALGIPSAPL